MAGALKKMMVAIGLADEEHYDVPEKPVAVRGGNAEPAATRATITPLRRHTGRSAAAADLSEIVTVHPKVYADARAVSDNFREGVPVIMNLSQMTESDARRLIDFASGLAQGLYGRIEKVSSKVFLLSPQHVAVSGEEAANTGEVDSTFFTQAAE